VRIHFKTLAAVVGAALIVVVAATGTAQAQGRGSAYRVPRTVDGQPDLQGIWQAVNTANFNIQDHSATLGVPAGMSIVEGNELPYLPGALSARQANYRERFREDPESKCFMVGTPRTMYMPFPLQIVQTKDQINIISEYAHTSRMLRLNSEHPDGPEWIMGDSRAHWEGDTLVVDVANFADGNWLDRSGNYTSNALHVVERFTRTGPDHIQYEATIEDPLVFSAPWKISFPLYRRVEPNAQLLEYECPAYLTAEHDKNDTQ
jgi:hypothetical protein